MARTYGARKHPSAAVIDTQSTCASPQGGESGLDAGKKVKGRKRNLVVNTIGLLIAVTVTAASVQDRDAGLRARPESPLTTGRALASGIRKRESCT